MKYNLASQGPWSTTIENLTVAAPVTEIDLTTVSLLINATSGSGGSQAGSRPLRLKVEVVGSVSASLGSNQVDINEPGGGAGSTFSVDLSALAKLDTSETYDIILTVSTTGGSGVNASIDNLVVSGILTQPSDVTPPTPATMSFAVAPNATGETTISMAATTASDASGVEYNFRETTGNSGGSDSGWQSGTNYTDTGLQPGTMYTYTVQARDQSANLNSNTISSAASATTVAADTDPPTPSPMTFASAPSALSATAITMTATTASDASGVEYYFAETSGKPGGSDSGWQGSATYINTGLSPNTAYTYTVQARDTSLAQNSNTASSASGASTLALPVAADILATDFTSVDTSDGSAPYVATSIAWDTVNGINAPVGELAFSEVGGDGEINGGFFSATDVISVNHKVGNGTPWYTTITLALDAGTALVTLTNFSLKWQSVNSGGSPNSGKQNRWVVDLNGSISGSLGSENTPHVNNGTFQTVNVDLGAFPSLDKTETYTLTLKVEDVNSAGNFAAFDDVVLSGEVTAAAGDNTAPSPGTMSFALAPSADSASAISMTATPASDANGVEYNFRETSGNPGGSDSGWQSDTNYTDTGLDASTTYSYTVQARDLSVEQNSNTVSAAAFATTDGADSIPPTPSPMTFAVAPAAAGETSVSMTATPASDASGVEYYFAETSGNTGGSDSGWQSGTNYTDTGLLPGTAYSYTVQARDLSVSQNATTVSGLAPATTDADGTAPTPDPMSFESAPSALADGESVAMTASLATDLYSSPVEYYFENTSNGNSRTWGTSRVWTNTGLILGQSYAYRVKARDALGNETGWSATANVTTITTILASDFTGVDTSAAGPNPVASSITWDSVTGIKAPANSLTFTGADGFFSAYANEIAVDRNLTTEGPWSTSIDIVLPFTTTTLELKDLILNWRVTSNSGGDSTPGSKTTTWTVDIVGSVSGSLGSANSSGAPGNPTQLRSIDLSSFTLVNTESYTLTLTASATGHGHNASLQDLALTGTPAYFFGTLFVVR